MTCRSQKESDEESLAHLSTFPVSSSTSQEWVCCFALDDCDSNDNFVTYIECIFGETCPRFTVDCDAAIGTLMGVAPKVGYALGAVGIMMAAIAGHIL